MKTTDPPPIMAARREFIQRALAATASLVSWPAFAKTPRPMNTMYFQQQDTKRRELMALLGDLPTAHKPAPPKLTKKEEHPGFTLEYYTFDFNGLEPVPGILLIPHKRQPKAPAMIYCHAHGGTYALGKDELLKGRDVLPAYAPVCAEKGIVTLAIDSWCFGERNRLTTDPTGETNLFKQMLWEGKSLFGMMLFDELRALDFLIQRPEVDPKRMGVFGLSMGATKAWWLAALDTRFSTCMDLCCLTDFDALIRDNGLNLHGVYYYVPGLLKKFSTSTLNELIVPRPRISLNGRLDKLTPPDGVERVRDYLLPLYKRYGNESDLVVELFDCPHEETPSMRKKILEWMDRYLVSA